MSKAPPQSGTFRREVIIEVLDRECNTTKIWILFNAWPNSYKPGNDLNANSEEKLIEEIKTTNKCDFDLAIAEPDMMRNLSQIAKILGPRGLMPSPKIGTVTTEIKKTINELQKGKISFKNDAGANLHQPIGKASWTQDKIKNNVEAFLYAVNKTKPGGVKKAFIQNIVLTSTMGPSIKIQL